MTKLIAVEVIKEKIFFIRGKKVMLDRDLADLYEVPTSQLTRQVRRNIDRFPQDFMIQLTQVESNNLICQIGTSSWGGTRKPSFAFTEQGIAMLSSVLRSKRAVQVNIAIMRAFVQLRAMLSAHKELTEKLKELERKVTGHDEEIQTIFRVIHRLVTEPEPKEHKKRIGFVVDKK